ncbi:MAG: Inner membrane protein YgjV [Firmicutes bacterium ADurb.Bin300]|jgi:hypothetical protein|nr:MAG: Inner membrane protein YgjV [Firmicutes bacterium ADurb.Bin300]
MVKTVSQLFSLGNDPVQIIAQLIGFAGAVTYFLVFQMKKRKSILGLNILAGAIFVLHFFLLKAYTGAAMNIVCSLRCIIYYCNDKKWAKSKAWLAVFILVSVVLGVYTWSDAYSILPLVSMIITSISFWLKRERNIRLLTLPSPPCWMLYNIHNGSISGFLTDTVIFISLLISLVRYDVLKRHPANRKQTFTV